MDFAQRLEQRPSPHRARLPCTWSVSSFQRNWLKLETLLEDVTTPLSFTAWKKFNKASPRILTLKLESIESVIRLKLSTFVRFLMWKRSEHPESMSTTAKIARYPHPTTHHAAWRKPCCCHKLDQFDRTPQSLLQLLF